MNSAELIAALRYCKDHERCDNDSAAECPYEHHWTDGEDCESLLLADAAAALEAADKRIDGLQKLVDINTERCEALRKQLRESHESYEQRIAELEEEHNKTVTAIFGEEQLWWENRCKELEAQIPKEAHWVAIYNGMGVCSNCNRQDSIDNMATHCRYCGARMRGEEK